MASLLSPYLRKKATKTLKSNAADRQKEGPPPATCFAKVFDSGDEQSTESWNAPYNEDISDTQSLTMEDLSIHSLTVNSEDSRVYGYGYAVPDLDDHFVRDKELKLAGTRWRRATKTMAKYLELNIVTQDTILMARRNPTPSRSGPVRQRVVAMDSLSVISPLRLGADNSDNSIRSNRRRVRMTSIGSRQRSTARRHCQL